MRIAVIGSGISGLAAAYAFTGSLKVIAADATAIYAFFGKSGVFAFDPADFDFNQDHDWSMDDWSKADVDVLERTVGDQVLQQLSIPGINFGVMRDGTEIPVELASSTFVGTDRDYRCDPSHAAHPRVTAAGQRPNRPLTGSAGGRRAKAESRDARRAALPDRDAVVARTRQRQVVVPTPEPAGVVVSSAIEASGSESRLPNFEA